MEMPLFSHRGEKRVGSHGAYFQQQAAKDCKSSERLRDCVFVPMVKPQYLFILAEPVPSVSAVDLSQMGCGGPTV